MTRVWLVEDGVERCGKKWMEVEGAVSLLHRRVRQGRKDE